MMKKLITIVAIGTTLSYSSMYSVNFNKNIEVYKNENRKISYLKDQI